MKNSSMKKKFFDEKKWIQSIEEKPTGEVGFWGENYEKFMLIVLAFALLINFISTL